MRENVVEPPRLVLGARLEIIEFFLRNNSVAILVDNPEERLIEVLLL